MLAQACRLIMQTSSDHVFQMILRSESKTTCTPFALTSSPRRASGEPSSAQCTDRNGVVMQTAEGCEACAEDLVGGSIGSTFAIF